MTKKIDPNKLIDERIANILRDNVKDTETWIQQEINKAGYILWFQGTILFIAAMKIGSSMWLIPKIAVIIFFLVSATISFLTIKGEGKIKHIDVINKKIFDRENAVKEMTTHYQIAKKMFFKKLKLNKINMILQIFLLLAVLIVLLFGNG